MRTIVSASRPVLLRRVLLLIGTGACAVAPCSTGWLPGDSSSGANMSVIASTLWERSGADACTTGHRGNLGQVFHRYVVPFEVDASSSLTAITSSNAFIATIGVF